MNQNWQFGQWGRVRPTHIITGMLVRYVGIDNPTGDYGLFVSKQETHKRLLKHVEHLPDCTGWDWKPIEPPPGYRLMNDDEIVESGDMSLSKNGCWFASVSLGMSVRALIAEKAAIAYARKLPPKYRPFRDDAEFGSHRDRWLRPKGNARLRYKVCEYDDTYIWTRSGFGETFADAFKLREFADGTPFGVLENE